MGTPSFYRFERLRDWKWCCYSAACAGNFCARSPALRAFVGAAPEPSIGGNPPTWLCDRQFYAPLVAYA